jgi:CRP-like cAMP-binding protein
LPLFARVSVDELFRIAGSGRQARHEPGTVLLQEGIVPTTVHILLDGHVVVSRQSEAPATITAPAALGLEEVLQGAPASATARAVDLVVTLALSVDDLRTLLADNTDLVRGLFATLTQAWGPAAVPLVSSTTAGGDFQTLADKGLTAVEKVLALQRVPMFTRVDAGDMLPLANAAHTVPIVAGGRLFEASASPALWVVLAGEVSLEIPDGSPVVGRAGDVIGAGALLTGQPLGIAASGTKQGLALRIDREDFFDVIEQRPGMLPPLFVALFKDIAPEPAAV